MGVVKFSYSRLSTYKKCPFKYKLQYEDKHYAEGDTLATELGTLIHYIEEHISLAFLNGEKPDYEKLLDDYYNINNPKTSPQDMDNGQFGINILKKKYQGDYYDMDDQGQSYATRCEWYAKEGIYRQEKFINEHPTWKLVDVEKYFEFTYEGFTIKGYIDRVWLDTVTREYIIDDIKTKNKLFDEKETKTPLQHCIYAMALKEAYGLITEPTRFYYDLPFVNTRQLLGTMGCIKRAKTSLTKIFAGIKAEDWKAKPSPLCYYCNYGGLNPKQPEEGKHLCPYYSMWKPGSKDFSTVLNKWEGMEQHEKIMKHYLEEQCIDGTVTKTFDFNF